MILGIAVREAIDEELRNPEIYSLPKDYAPSLRLNTSVKMLNNSIHKRKRRDILLTTRP